MSAPARMPDWTAAWQPCDALALTAWTRDDRHLRDLASARLLELALESTLLRARLRVLAWVILPGSFHVVAPVGPDGRGVAWPDLFGHVKAQWTRWERERRQGTGVSWNARSGSPWRVRTRIHPLRGATVEAALKRCREAPHLAGLDGRGEPWPFSSFERRRGARLNVDDDREELT